MDGVRGEAEAEEGQAVSWFRRAKPTRRCWVVESLDSYGRSTIHGVWERMADAEKVAARMTREDPYGRDHFAMHHTFHPAGSS